MHIDHLFQGTLTDNGAMPCVDDFQEVAGIWLELKIARSGQLAFDLVPDDPDQDLDFTLFRGNDCGTLEAVRCVGGGWSTEGHFDCMGATGLREDESDYFEMMGCPEGQNNYSSALDVEKGEHFLLFVHGFNNAGGFGLLFNGSLLEVPESVQNGIIEGWVDGHVVLEYRDVIGHSAQVVWSIFHDSPEVKFGPGPHRIKVDFNRGFDWSSQLVFGDQCICKLNRGGSGNVRSKKDQGISFWPNPASNVVRFKSKPQIEQQNVEVEIFNSTGKLVHTFQLADDVYLWNPSIQGAYSGQYFIRVVGRSLSDQILIMH